MGGSDSDVKIARRLTRKLRLRRQFLDKARAMNHQRVIIGRRGFCIFARLLNQPNGLLTVS